MSERKEGWYHVKVGDYWTCAYWHGKGWTVLGVNQCSDKYFDEIGQRIPSPEEPWVTVPVEPTQEMQNAGSVARYHERKDCKGVYHAMTSAAPKPGDEQ